MEWEAVGTPTPALPGCTSENSAASRPHMITLRLPRRAAGCAPTRFPPPTRASVVETPTPGGLPGAMTG